MIKVAATALLLACAFLACTAQGAQIRLADASNEAADEADLRVSGPVFSVTPKGGSNFESQDDLSPYDISCPRTTSFITGLNIRQGTILAKRKELGNSKVPIDIIEAIAPVFCSDGGVASTNVPVLPSGARRIWWHPKSPTGYTGIKLRVGDVIDAVSMIEERLIDSFFGGSGGELDSVRCPTGYLITGLYGEATKDHIVTLGLRCRKVAR